MSDEIPNEAPKRSVGLMDRLKAIGWVREYAPSAKGMAVDWTDEGADKMATLWALYDEIGTATLTAENREALLILALERHIASLGGFDPDGSN